MTPLKVVGSTLGFVVLVTLIVLGGWRLGWWMNQKGTDYQNHIFQHSYGTQTAYIEQLNQSVVDVASVDAQIASASTQRKFVLRAQRTAMVNQACDIASRITTSLTPTAAQFVAANC